jgi:programmed cell death protein 4
MASDNHFKGYKDKTKNRDAEKKQGGGGYPKGVWEQDVSLQPCIDALDPNDPNYDPMEQAEYDLVSKHFSSDRNSYDKDGPQRTFAKTKLQLAEFKKEIIKIIEEYFSSEDTQEVGRSLGELDSSSFHFEFVKRAISMSMDRKDKERELVSKLFSALFEYDRGLLSTNQIGKGFERIFEVVDDLEIDIPKARTMVSQFLARAVVDELIPPSFLRDPLVEGMGGEIVENAVRMLSVTHGTARVEKVWGPGDGRSVPDLKQAVDLLLQVGWTSK